MSLMVCGPERRKIITKHLNLKGIGVEFGPIMRIVLDKNSFNVQYADYADKSTLQQEYKDNKFVDVNKIPEIDFVLSEKYLDEVSGQNRFDYIIASHVAEHVPDLIRWLESCVKALKPGGVLSLALPNANYTFDLTRRRTRLCDVLAAYVECRRKPTIAQIADHFGGVVHANSKDIWNGTINAENAKRLYKDRYVLRICKEVFDANVYKNCHCWVFDEIGFESLLREILDLGMVNFDIIEIISTKQNEGEFFCFLRKTSMS